MKIYRVNLQVKILSIIICLLIILSIILIIFDTNASILLKLMVPFMIFFTVVGGFSFNKLKVIVDDEKIEVRIPLRKYNSLSWNEIKEVTSFYILFPEAGGITLIPGIQTGKKNVHISIWGMPIQLMLDILSHLPPDAGVYLYPYLKRKIERKQTWFYKN